MAQPTVAELQAQVAALQASLAAKSNGGAGAAAGKERMVEVLKKAGFKIETKANVKGRDCHKVYDGAYFLTCINM